MDDDHPPSRTSATSCPHVDRNDLRCMHRFSLGRIEQAFAICFGAFHACPMFHRINLDDQRARKLNPTTRPDSLHAVKVTLNGLPVHTIEHSAQPLAPTGS